MELIFSSHRPNLLPHISAGPFRHTVLPQESRVAPYPQSASATAASLAECWEQEGGSGLPATHHHTALEFLFRS